jgi:hypothetical protein
VSVRLRPLLAGALGLTLVGSGIVASASAAPAAKACNLVKDDKGDGSGLIDSSSGGLDILSADVASDAKNVTAVLRLAAAPPAAGDPNAPEGASYYVEWAAKDAANPVYLTAGSDVTGAFSYAMGEVQPSPAGGGQLFQNSAGTVTGHVDGAKITITVERSVFSALSSVKPGSKLTSITADIFYPVEVPGVGGLLQQADNAVGSKAYVAGSRSCVTPGKG